MIQPFELFQYEFFTRAFISAILTGAALPLAGVVLILRRLSLFTDTMSHVALAGVAVANLFSWAPVYIALVVTGATSSLLEELRMRNKLPSDVLLALLLYSSLAFTLIVFVNSPNQLTTFLFGSILSSNLEELILVIVIMTTVIVLILLFSREISQIALNSDLAKSNGIQVVLINRILILLVSAAIVISIFIMGTLLVGALLIIPALTSLRRAHGVLSALIGSSVFGIIAAVTGLFVSYYLDWPASSTIVVNSIAILVISEVEMFIRLKLRALWLSRQPAH